MADQGEGPLFIWGKNTKKIADGRKGNRVSNVQDLLLFYALNTKPDVPDNILKGNKNCTDKNYNWNRYVVFCTNLGISARLLDSFPSPLQSLANPPNKAQ